MQDAIIKKCQEFGLSAKEYIDPRFEKPMVGVIGTTGKRHIIFYSDIPHIEAWVDEDRGVNHSDWLGNIDSLGDYLANI